MPTLSFSQIVSSTLRKTKKTAEDNMSSRIALLRYMKAHGGIRKEDGGYSIQLPLDYTNNSTVQRFSDWDILNIQASDTLTSAEYQWRQIAVHVTASGREMAMNNGDSKLIDLATYKIENAMRSFNNTLASDLLSDGTATNQINGLQALIADTNTNTVGGISGSDWSFWRNRVTDASVLGVTTSSTTIENDLMLPTWLAIDRGPDDAPDVIVMDSVYYSYFEKSQTSLKRYAKADKAKGGFEALQYKTADVVYDSFVPASHAYFVNSRYLKLVVHKDRNLEVQDAVRLPNQDGEVIPIMWMGNLTCSNRAQQGVIHE